jgi:diadenosine tetraphosphate (Ap4A) HIT family hydrolase
MSEIVEYYYGRLKSDGRKYRTFLKQWEDGCSFCAIDHPDNTVVKIVEQYDDFWVIKNAFPYALFDSIEVADHLLVVPKKHAESIAELDKHERQKLIEILSRYEALGYSIMARGPGNNAKSMFHQHTHLIKIV